MTDRRHSTDDDGPLSAVVRAAVRAAVIPGPDPRADTVRAVGARRIGSPVANQLRTSGRRASGPLCGPVRAGGFRADAGAHGPTDDGSGPRIATPEDVLTAVGPGDMSPRPELSCQLSRPNARSGRRGRAGSGADSQIPMRSNPNAPSRIRKFLAEFLKSQCVSETAKISKSRSISGLTFSPESWENPQVGKIKEERS